MTAAKLAIQLILTVGVGFFAARAKIIGDDFEKQLTSLIMKIILPCMIVKSMMGAFSMEALKNSGQLLLLAVLLLVITFVLGQLVYRLMGRTSSARVMRFSMIFTNFTFIGIPVIEALYGDMGVFYFVIFVVPYRLVYYSSAKPMLSPPGLVQEKPTFGARLKGWLSPPLVAVFVGLFLYLTQIRLPSPIAGVVNSLGSCASPLGMLLCGMSLGRYPIRKLLKPRYLWLPAARNLLIPALALALCLLVGLKKELAQIMVMFAALPVASLLAAFTIQYDPDRETQFEAAASVLLSTLFCALTIPLWAALLNFFFK